MKSALLSFVTALGLFAVTTASAAPLADHRPPSARERARDEAMQREQYRLDLQRARLAEQRSAAQQRAAERARSEALHRHDRTPHYGYNHR